MISNVCIIISWKLSTFSFSYSSDWDAISFQGTCCGGSENSVPRSVTLSLQPGSLARSFLRAGAEVEAARLFGGDSLRPLLPSGSEQLAALASDKLRRTRGNLGKVVNISSELFLIKGRRVQGRERERKRSC